MRNEDSCCTRFYNNVRRVWASPPKKTEAKKPPNRRPAPPITNGHEYHPMAQALGNGYQHDDTQSQRNSPPFDSNDRHDQMMQQALLASYHGDPQEKMKDIAEDFDQDVARGTSCQDDDLLCGPTIHRALKEAASDETALAYQFREYLCSEKEKTEQTKKLVA